MSLNFVRKKEKSSLCLIAGRKLKPDSCSRKEGIFSQHLLGNIPLDLNLPFAPQVFFEVVCLLLASH
jgi:hypothetical protein